MVIVHSENPRTVWNCKFCQERFNSVMDGKLTVYLFGTLVSKPKGLRVRLRVLLGSQNFETFSELQIPGATLMSHGLYLAFPTPSAIRDPALFGLLNQKILRDDEPNTEFGVFWSAREFLISKESLQAQFTESIQDCLSKQIDLGDPAASEQTYLWGHNLSFIKNGIIKNLRHSIDFDGFMGKYFKSCLRELHFQEFCAQSMPDLLIPPIEYESFRKTGSSEVFGPPDAYPITPSLIFLRFMQNLSQKFEGEIAASKGSSRIVSELQDTWKPVSASHHQTSTIPINFMQAIGKLLVSFHSTLVHLKRFLPPTEQIDRQLYESAVQNTQNELQDLANAILKSFLEPFCDTLSKLATQGAIDSTNFTLESCRSVLASKALIEKLRYFGEIEFNEISLLELEINLPHSAGLSSFSFLEAFSRTLEIRRFNTSFFKLVESALQPYSLDSDILDKAVHYLIDKKKPDAGPVHRQMQYFITDDFARPADRFMSTIGDYKFCVFGSAKNNHLIRFSPRLEQADDWKLIAVITWRQTSICIITERILIEEPPEPNSENCKGKLPDTIPHVKVFRLGVQIGSFKLEPNLILGENHCPSRSIQYFTGRYFVRYKMSPRKDTAELFVLDLAPCILAEPKAPKHFSKLLSEMIGQDDPLPIDYACTDKFLSYLASSPTRNRRGRRVSTPGILGRIMFSNLEGQKPIDILHCGDLFERIERQIGRHGIYSNADSTTQILWSGDLHRLFYTNWTYDEKITSKRLLVISCFEVSTSFDSIRTLTFGNYQLNYLMQKELLLNNTPRFGTMIIREKEYLVMDVIKRFENLDQNSSPQSHIIARSLFILHKDKLHWVPVNRHLLYRFPQYIGKQLGYAGFDTSRMALFHHRRVFSADKVLYNLYRLDYKAL